MDKSVSFLNTINKSLTMAKYRGGYRWKSGNCNKPFRYFRNHNNFMEESRNFRSCAGSSQNKVSDCQESTDELRTFSGNDERTSPHMSLQSSSQKKPKRYDNFKGERITHPPELKGAEIGLWYARRMKAKREEEEKLRIVEIKLEPDIEKQIENVLRSYESQLLESELDAVENEQERMTFEERIENAVLDENINDEGINGRLLDELLKKKNNADYKKIMVTRTKLPTFDRKDELVKLINENNVVVVSGGTGCGKTTQIVQYVLDDHILNNKGSLCNIICTQPRRITTITVAERVAYERNEDIGKTVGYQIRLEAVKSSRKKGSINFMTTGVLIAHLASNPILNGVSHIFIDEIHERNVESDILMCLLKYIIPKRPDLRIVLMSATLNSNDFSKFFNNAPTIDIPGFIFPVEEIYLDRILDKTKFKFLTRSRIVPDKEFIDYIVPYCNDLELTGQCSKFVSRELRNPLSEELNNHFVVEVVRYICMTENSGAILVFLPGLSDINAVHREIKNSVWYTPAKYIIIPMHSIMPTVHQKEAFRVPPKGVRKIIIATSILETSITINDVAFVVDSGKIKQFGFDLERKVATLKVSWISLANAKQRKGRAGRTKPGKCYKLYTKVRENLFNNFPDPEIQSVSLENVILQTKLFNLGQVTPFLEKLMDPPDPELTEVSLKVLENINALDDQERLTPLGYHLAKLPMHPRTGKMILLAAIFSCFDPVLSIATCLSFKDPFMIPLGLESEVRKIKEQLIAGEKSDHYLYCQLFKEWDCLDVKGRERFCNRSYLSLSTMKLISEMKNQFGRQLYSMKFLPSPDVKDPVCNVNSDNIELIKAILFAGLNPNIAHLTKINQKARKIWLQTSEHKTVFFHGKSYCSKVFEYESPYFVYHTIMESSNIFIHDATMIHYMPLLFFGKKLDLIDNYENYILKVNDFIMFKTDKNTGQLIKTLRENLDNILTSVMSNPTVFDWHEGGEEIDLLNTIVNLCSLKSKENTKTEK